MQHQHPYSFSFLEWTRLGRNPDGSTDQNCPAVRRRTTRCFVVGPERTRKGELVIKSRNSWDNEAHTRLKMEKPSEAEIKEQTENHGLSRTSNAYFWNCMEYGAALALIDSLEGGDAAYDQDRDLTSLLPIPTYGMDYTDYFGILIKAVPSLKLKRVEVGW